METKAVIFDKDGTVLDFDSFWIPVTTGAAELILQKLGCTQVPLKEVMEAMGCKDGVVSVTAAMCSGTYGDMAEKMNEVLEKYGAACDLERLTQLMEQAHCDRIEAGVIAPACENITSVMEQLKDSGAILVLVTADGKEMTERCLKGLGIFDDFSLIYTDDGTHPNKPDPYCIHAVQKKYGLRSEQIVMVGDSPKDMEFARNGNVRGIAVAKTEESRQMLLQMTDTVVPDISFLPEVLT